MLCAAHQQFGPNQLPLMADISSDWMKKEGESTRDKAAAKKIHPNLIVVKTASLRAY